MESLKTLWRMVAYHKQLLPICCGIIMFVSGLAVVVPLYTKFVLEYIIAEKATRLLTYSFIFYLAIVFSRFLFMALQDLAVVVLRQKLERTYNEKYIAAILNLKPRTFQSYNSGDLIARFRVFINEIEWFLCDFLFFVFYALFIFTFLSAVMLVVNPLLFLVVLAFMPLHFFNFNHYIKPLSQASERGEQAQAKLTSFALQSVSAWADIRNYFLQNTFIERNQALVHGLNSAYFERKRYGYQQEYLQSALIFINHVVVIAFGGYQIIIGQTSVGTLFFFLLLLDFFYSPIYRFSRVNESLQAAAVKVRRMAELIDSDQKETIEAITPPAAGDAVIAPVRQLSLQGVSLAPLFNDLHFQFEAGRIYFITGPSGCGKSSLFNLLTRFMDMDDGALLINGEDTTSWSDSKLRNHVQTAIQESQLFKRSISRNIHLGDPADLDEQRLNQACYQAVADEFIQQLPLQFDTQVAENGANFSGGQQQRLNLARLFYHDPPVMLLDEPTSALDVASEKQFFKRLHAIKADKIILVINHRVQNFNYADIILKLNRNGLEIVPQNAPA